MSQKANVIRKALTRQGFIVDSVEWKPFQRGAIQDEDTGGWKAETTCKGCGLHQTFGGLSIDEVLYTIETISCIVCQALKLNIARLVATYPIHTIEVNPADPETIKQVGAVLDKMEASGMVTFSKTLSTHANQQMILESDEELFFAHPRDKVYNPLTRQQVFDDFAPILDEMIFRFMLEDKKPDARFEVIQLEPPSAIHDFLRGYMNDPQAREPVDENFGPSTTYQRATYKNWHHEPLLRPGLIDFLPDPTTLRCSSCKAACRPFDPSWRYTGSSYEHKCPENHPMAGYFAAEPIESPKE